MGDERHATRERLQHRGRAPERERLERLAARQHQHDERAGEVLLQQHRGDDGDAGQQVGAELAPNELECEGQHERYTAGCEHDVQRQVACGGDVSLPQRNARCATIPATARAAMTVARPVVLGHHRRGGEPELCRTAMDGLATFMTDDHASGRPRTR